MAADIRHRLARMLGDLAVEMQAQKGTANTLRAIVDAAPLGVIVTGVACH